MCSIDTLGLRVHGINQQKTDTLSILRHNKELIAKQNRYLSNKNVINEFSFKDKINFKKSVRENIKKLEDENRSIEDKTYNKPILEVPAHFDLYAKMMEFKGKSFTRKDVFHTEDVTTNVNSREEQLSSRTSKVINKHFLQQERMRLTDGDYVRTKTLKTVGKFALKSSSPDVNFTINPDGGFIDIHFSIPKYLYMHNLAQFVPQIDSKNYKSLAGNFYQWDVQRNYLHGRLMKFLNRFLQDLFTFFSVEDEHGKPLEANLDYIELRRIDLCFNQIFETKEDALLYLEHQKKIHKKSNLRYKQIDQDFETSIAFHTAKHEYFKIYHKGSEYKSVKYGDFQKHHKINKLAMSRYSKFMQEMSKLEQEKTRNNKAYLYSIFNDKKEIIFKKFENDVKDKPFDLRHLYQDKIHKIKIDGINQSKFEQGHNKILREELQLLFDDIYKHRPINTNFIKDEADKILRYEMSISGYSLNNVFKRKIFRKNCKVHRHYKKVYTKVKRVDARVDGYTYKVTPQDRRDYQMMHDFYNRTSNFTLTKRSDILFHQKKSNSDYSTTFDSYSIQKSYWKFGLKTVLENHDVFSFTNNFLQTLVDKFKEKIDYYQLKVIQPYDDLVSKVKKFNSICEKKLESYNNLNDYKCYDVNKNRRIYKGRILKNAAQALTESERRKLGMQKVNIANVAIIFKLMTGKEKMSFSQIKKHLAMSDHSFYRRKRALESLGIYESTLSLEKKVNAPLDYSNYYHKLKSLNFKKHFFFQQEFAVYG